MAMVLIGKVTVPGHGVPVAFSATHVGVQSVTFEALPANVGVVYIGLKSMVRSTLVNVLRILPKPVSATTGPFTTATFEIPLAPAGLDLQDLYIDVDTDNDGVLAYATVQ